MKNRLRTLSESPIGRREFTLQSAMALQATHKRLASRCAVIRITLDAILKGATPMLRSRVTVVGASFV